MVNLTFGEQVKIILSRKGMTIKQLAELVEQTTGKPMSRQNMTQRLGRDNFQEQDMRLIAEILGCKFQLSIMEMEDVEVPTADAEMAEVPVADAEMAEVSAEEESNPLEREITIGELVVSEAVMEEKAELTPEEQERELLKKGVRGYFKKTGNTEAVKEDVKEEDTLKEDTPSEDAPIQGDINPYTGKEYKSNSVRMHPKRIGYVQVYDQEQHQWTDMTEWAFLGYQERKKVLLGKDYQPPIYLD